MATIVVDPDYGPGEEEKEVITPDKELVSWIMQYVKPWRDHAVAEHKDDWDRWNATWRGKFVTETRAKKSERSKLVAPLTMMAVDLTVAEIIEGLFGRETFFDLPDDYEDEQKGDLEAIQRKLHEDLYKDKIVACMTEIVLNGALYGTGIAKIIIEVRKVPKLVRNKEGNLTSIDDEVIKIYPVPVEPGQLIVDPAGLHIDDMVGVGHEYKAPLHKVKQLQYDGTYYRDYVGPGTAQTATDGRTSQDAQGEGKQWALMLEWHGLVPKHLLAAARSSREGEDDEIVDMLMAAETPELVEAVVSIANDGILLQAIPNPSPMKDRALLSYQHDAVPNRFWGRGVCEKGDATQRATDAEMRSRIDNLTWVANPQLVVNLANLPPRMNLDQWPGKVWGLRGGDAQRDINQLPVGEINASSFQQTEHLESLHQKATGALDSIMSLRGNVRDETATGSAMSASGFIKRSKRTMFAIEGFLGELVQRILWRKMEFEPDRYPGDDVKFNVKGAMGIMAREVEQNQLAQLLQYEDPSSPIAMLIKKEIYSNTAAPNKEQFSQIVDQQLQPPSEEDQAIQAAVSRAQAQLVIEQVRNVQADTAKKLSEAGHKDAQALFTQIQADLEEDREVLENARVRLEAEKVDNQAEQNQISRESLDLQRQKLRQDNTGV